MDQNIKDLSEGKISQVDRGRYLESIRENSRALVVHEEVKETTEFSNYTNLGMSAPSSYSSEIFSNLPYEDVKKAHTETLIPVTKKLLEGMVITQDVDCFELCDLLRLKLKDIIYCSIIYLNHIHSFH